MKHPILFPVSCIPLILAIIAFFSLAPDVGAQRTLGLRPDNQKVDQPANFLAANGLVATLGATGINGKTAATTTITPAIATGQSFYVTGVHVVTTAAVAITGGAAVFAGTTNLATNSILTTQTLANAPIVNGQQAFLPTSGSRILREGDSLTFTVGTPATGVSQTFAVYFTGFYQEPSLSATPTPTASPSPTP